MRGRPVWERLLLVACAVLTLAGSVLLFTGPVTLGAILLVAAQPTNVFLAFRSRAASLE